MNLEMARETIRNYWNVDHSEDFSHLRPGEYEARIVLACEVLEDEGTYFDQACVEHIQNTAPTIFDYDRYGNWIGNMKNENGWAA